MAVSRSERGTRGRLFRRLRRRARRGFGLLEAMLALVVAAVAVLAVNTWIELERSHARARDSGRTVAVLADAATHHVQTHYEDLVGGGAMSLTEAALKADGILPANFVFGDAMKRDLAVLVLPSAAGVRVLAGQVPDAVDGRRPYAAVTQGLEGQRLGMVEMSRCPAGITAPCLMGPGIEESVSAFNTPFPNQVREGAIMALYEFDHADWCGDFLHRTPTSLCTGGNRMGQDVTITGRLTNASSIEDVTSLVMHGALSIGERLEVGGTLESEGRMTAGTGVQAVTARVDGAYGAGAENPACQVPTALSAACNEDRVVVGRTLDVADTIDVLGRTGPVIDGDTDAGQVAADCLHVRGTARVEGRVRVTGSYGTPAGTCP